METNARHWEAALVTARRPKPDIESGLRRFQELQPDHKKHAARLPRFIRDGESRAWFMTTLQPATIEGREVC